MAMLCITADEAVAPMWEEEDVEEENDGGRLADVIQPRSISGGQICGQSTILLKTVF